MVRPFKGLTTLMERMAAHSRLELHPARREPPRDDHGG